MDLRASMFITTPALQISLWTIFGLVVQFQGGRRLSRCPGVSIDRWESRVRWGGWALGRWGGRVMNRGGREVILPRDLASPVTGIIQGKNLQRKQWIWNSVKKCWNFSQSLVQNYICMLGVIPNQFFCRKTVNLVIHSCCFFISYCVKVEDFTIVFSGNMSGWSIYPKGVVIDCDVDLSTDYVLAIVSR